MNDKQPASNKNKSNACKASFTSDVLEPRILLSATWVEADSSSEQHDNPVMSEAAVATEAQAIFEDLEDNDEVFASNAKEGAFARAEFVPTVDRVLAQDQHVVEFVGEDKRSGADHERNFITNGSFENYSGDPLKSGQWRAFKELEGWTLNEGPQFEVVEADHSKFGISDGNHWLDTDASPGNIDFSQKVEGLTASHSYTLSFDTMSRGGDGSATLVAYWNGEKIAVVEGASGEGWKTNTFEVTSGSGDGTDTLRFTEVGSVDNQGTALDNVRLFANNNIEPADHLTDTLEGEAGLSTIGDEPFSLQKSLERVSFSISEGSVAPGEKVAIRSELPKGVDPQLIQIRISGLPTGAQLSAGADLGGGQWLLSGSEMEDLTLVTNSVFDGDFEIQMTTSIKSSDPIYHETFEDNAEGWSKPSIDGNEELSKVLGRFGGTGGEQAIFKTFKAPEGATSVIVEFDFLEIDSWDGEKFLVFANDKVISDQTFFTHHSTYEADGDKLNSIALDSGTKNQGFSGWSDQRHRYSFEIPVQNGEFKIGFGSTLNQSIVDESFAIDNFVVSTGHSSQSSLQLSVKHSVQWVSSVDGDFADGPVTVTLDAQTRSNLKSGTVQIDNVPDTVTLSSGTKASDGSWLLTAEEATKFQLVGNYEGTADLLIRSTFSTEGILHEETFDKRTTGWNDNTVTTGGDSLGTFLGRVNDAGSKTGDGQTLFKTFVAPEGVSSVRVEFDFLEIDSWDGEKFQVFANDKLISSQSFFTHHSTYDADGDKADSIALDSGQRNQGFSGWADQRHRYSIEVPVENGRFKLGFGSTLNQGLSDESWGIDNLKIIANQTIDATTSVSVNGRIIRVPVADLPPTDTTTDVVIEESPTDTTSELVIGEAVRSTPVGTNEVNPTDRSQLGFGEDRDTISSTPNDALGIDADLAFEKAENDFRGGSEIDRTIGDLASLLSEFDRMTSVEGTVDQVYTLTPSDRIDWNGVEFAEMVETSFDERALSTEQFQVEAKAESANLAVETEQWAEKEAIVAIQEKQSSTLSRLWSLVRAYGGVKAKV